MAQEKPCSPAGSKIRFENTFYKYWFALHPEGCVAYGVTKTYLKPLQITSKTLVLVSDILWHHVQEGKPSLLQSPSICTPEKDKPGQKKNIHMEVSTSVFRNRNYEVTPPQNKWHWDEMVPRSSLIGSSFHLCKQNILVPSNRGYKSGFFLLCS